MAEGETKTESPTKVLEQKDRPKFLRLVAHDQRSEKEKSEGTILFRNWGSLEIELDTQAFSQLLRQEGLKAEQVSQLTVTFLDGMTADRNFHGDVIGGGQGGNWIEVFTTLPATSGRVRIDRIPIKEKTLASFLLHELRHYLQDQKAEFPEGRVTTFWKERDEVEKDEFEKEANRFAKAHLQEALGWLHLTEFPFLPFEDNRGEDRVVGEMAGYGHHYDLDRRLTVFDADNPVLYLEQDFGKLKKEVQDKTNWSGAEVRLKELVGEARRLVEARKLGFSEFNGLQEIMAVAFDEAGRSDLARLSQDSKYK